MFPFLTTRLPRFPHLISKDNFGQSDWRILVCSKTVESVFDTHSLATQTCHILCYAHFELYYLKENTKMGLVLD